MDHDKTRSTDDREHAHRRAWRATALGLGLAATTLATCVALGCAGADGDPAPAAQEAGAAELPACVDAGATE